MNREDLEKLSTADLVALTLADMKFRLSAHQSFLETALITRTLGRFAVANDLPARTPQDVITKQVSAVAGRFDDPRIAELPLALAMRIGELVARLGGKRTIDDVETEEMRELIKDIKQFDADIQPVYAWNAEIQRDLDRAALELN